MDEFHERHLPHFQPLGGLFFVTFNLHGCVPKEIYKQWEQEFNLEKEKIMLFSKNKNEDLNQLGKITFVKKDKFLDNYLGGKQYLRSDSLAKIVADTLHFWDGKRLELFAYCIMSNHVHVILRLFNDTEIDTPSYLQEIMHSIKRFSARECNKLLGETGKFWQDESYDRLIRDDKELHKILIYILNNPVKAKLCKQMKDWKWSYIKEIYNDIM